MQDLRTEFYKGKTILNQSLLLTGDESISCTPIDDQFNNRVYGWSTSISVVGVNESTQCNIPYHITESWDGATFISPLIDASTFLWLSATENLQELATVGSGVGSAKYITSINALVSTAVPQANDTQLNSFGNTIKMYDYAKGGINMDLTGQNLYGGYDLNVFGVDNTTFDRLTIALKVSHIKDITAGSKYVELLSFVNLTNSGESDKGFRILLGGSECSPSAFANKIIYEDVATGNKTDSGFNISDGSNDYLRETNFVLGLGLYGEDYSSAPNGVKLYIDGQHRVNEFANTDLNHEEAFKIIIGSELASGGNNNGSNFIFKELFVKNALVQVNRLSQWLLNR